ncbi:MAG: HAD-IG family 5'-nucleotidase [Fuerstiella sp.]|nr:HAD-IG family 5'-nucleotidase [Fuerstiella sp.]MCP4856334.1 HAD-IG family 5'-nucleotidase [Fuerstiella sp.]
MSLGFFALAVSAQDDRENGRAKPTSRKPPVQAAQANRPIVTKLSVDQENVALKFARTHHPELADLLERLRGSSLLGFSRGIREVHLAIQRLERFREKQPARFETELENWKTASQIRLLTAKWVMSQNPELEKRIRALLRARQQARLDRLREDRMKLAVRLQQLDDQIGMGTEELEVDLVNEWDRLAKQATASAKAHRRPSKKKSTAKDRSKPDTKKPGEPRTATK